jgi:hypothetical protein
LGTSVQKIRVIVTHNKFLLINGRCLELRVSIVRDNLQAAQNVF